MSISNTLKSKKISIDKHPITSTVKTRPWCANNKKQKLSQLLPYLNLLFNIRIQVEPIHPCWIRKSVIKITSS